MDYFGQVSRVAFAGVRVDGKMVRQPIERDQSYDGGDAVRNDMSNGGNSVAVPHQQRSEQVYAQEGFSAPASIDAAVGEVRFADPSHGPVAIQYLNGAVFDGMTMKVVEDRSAKDGSRVLALGLRADMDRRALSEIFSQVGTVAFATIRAINKPDQGFSQAVAPQHGNPRQFQRAGAQRSQPHQRNHQQGQQQQQFYQQPPRQVPPPAQAF